MEHFFESVLFKIAVQPIQRVSITNEMELKVTFINGLEKQHKIDPQLKPFLSIMKDKKCQKIHRDATAILSPIGYFDLLGFVPGDFALFEDDEDRRMIIQFS